MITTLEHWVIYSISVAIWYIIVYRLLPGHGSISFRIFRYVVFLTMVVGTSILISTIVFMVRNPDKFTKKQITVESIRQICNEEIDKRITNE